MARESGRACGCADADDDDEGVANSFGTQQSNPFQGRFQFIFRSNRRGQWGQWSRRLKLRMDGVDTICGFQYPHSSRADKTNRIGECGGDMDQIEAGHAFFQFVGEIH